MATKMDLGRFVTQVTRPVDFEEFWKGVMEEVAQIPLHPEISPDPLRSNRDTNVFQATYRSLDGIEIFAWYCIPAQGGGPFPAIIHLPGYKGEPTLHREWGSRGVITLSVAVRGKLMSNAEFNPGYPGLLTYGIGNRDTYAYKGVIADCSRGLDFLLSRQEVDPRRIYACGSSQGGGLTLITAALRQEIQGGVSGYPFLCCFPESMKMFRSYPYDELTCYARAYPESVPQMLETLRYYDVVNFADWIKCPIAVGIAMDDEVCPPETSFAAYRRLEGPKELWLFPNSGHGNAHGYSAKEAQWLQGQIQSSPA